MHKAPDIRIRDSPAGQQVPHKAFAAPVPQRWAVGLALHARARRMHRIEASKLLSIVELLAVVARRELLAGEEF
jgi:hypothetical protein